MDADRQGDLTVLLDEARTGRADARARLAGRPLRAAPGRADARDRLVGALYGELRRMAGGLMRRERPGHTLQPSALVHEALIRLLDGGALADSPNRGYLFAAA